MALQRTWCWFHPLNCKFLLQKHTDWQPPQTLNLSNLLSFTKTNSNASSGLSHYQSYCDYLQRYFLPCLLYLYSEHLRGYCLFMVYEANFYIILVFFIYIYECTMLQPSYLQLWYTFTYITLDLLTYFTLNLLTYLQQCRKSWVMPDFEFLSRTECVTTTAGLIHRSVTG